MLGVTPVKVESGRSASQIAVPGRGEPVFFTAGEQANGEFRCAGCGYGVIVRRLLPPCPMCRGDVWEEPAGSPFTHRTAARPRSS
jgi:hypothetical protein